MMHSSFPIRIGIATVLWLALPLTACAQIDNPYDSGGVLLPEQAAYDVQHYDLTVQAFPERKTLAGEVVVSAKIASPLSWFVLDLDPLLDVTGTWFLTDEGDQAVDLERRGGRLWLRALQTLQPGQDVQFKVAYEGAPRVAPNPPWDGGIQWEKTPSGADWIATSCQMIGADVWWPVKDHVSDEPTTMDIHIRVPEPLVAASNGRLREVEPHADGTRTYHSHLSNPINVYNVALNIASYRIIEGSLKSVAGDTFPIQFFVLPEDYEKGVVLFEEIKDHLRFYEDILGPYPFRADKYGVAQTPHLGMEHQTIIAYGAGFSNTAMTRGNDLGFDALHHHELAHEWWGNLVTNADWSDMWLHEGFGSYMQPLYRERLSGVDSYKEAMMQQRRGIANRKALSPDSTLSSQEIYAGHDIYSKGSWLLHTLRYLVGDDLFFDILRRQAYPDPAMESVIDGSQVRFGTTTDFISLAEGIADQDLGWFFDVYARQPHLPQLDVIRDGSTATLRWDVPGTDLPFSMPLDIDIDGRRQRVDMQNGIATVDVGEASEILIDPDNWILREGNLKQSESN
ncbi:MAG: M1 family metallopeptidase [Bacteroidetes bacterium]|nr:M1 family metallopeptidase [Bacteroidota bacterium]